jgi:nucleoid DNA-binding protein
MDIDLLSKMVKELILDKDRVVLPGLGSFVAEIVPSTFSDKGYTINPPYRRLFFRSRPDEGDELISFYASYNNVEREIADRIIRDFVKELKSVLHEKKTVVFPGLGRLRATKENNVFFVADETLDIYPEGFGLEPISLKTHQETAEEVTAAVEGLRSILAETAPVVAPVLEDAPLEQAVEVVPSVETVQAEPVAETSAEEVVAEAPVEEVLADIPVEETPAAEPQPEPMEPQPTPTEPQPQPAPVQTEPMTVAPAPSKPWRAVIWLAAAVAAALVAFAVLGHMRPDVVDRFLYTPEELEIVKML